MLVKQKMLNNINSDEIIFKKRALLANYLTKLIIYSYYITLFLSPITLYSYLRQGSSLK